MAGLRTRLIQVPIWGCPAARAACIGLVLMVMADSGADCRSRLGLQVPESVQFERMADGGGRLSQDHVRRGLPAAVGVGIRFLSETGPTPPKLHPLEEEILGPRAVAGRRILFALGRAAARDALLEL